MNLHTDYLRTFIALAEAKDFITLFPIDTLFFKSCSDISTPLNIF